MLLRCLDTTPSVALSLALMWKTLYLSLSLNSLFVSRITYNVLRSWQYFRWSYEFVLSCGPLKVNHEVPFFCVRKFWYSNSYYHRFFIPLQRNVLLKSYYFSFSPSVFHLCDRLIRSKTPNSRSKSYGAEISVAFHKKLDENCWQCA